MSVKCQNPKHWFWKKTKAGEKISGPVGLYTAHLLGLIKFFHIKPTKKGKSKCY